MSDCDEFGLLEDECDPLDILFAVSDWRIRDRASRRPDERPALLQGEFSFSWSERYWEMQVETYAASAGFDPGSAEREALGLVLRDSILFAEKVTMERAAADFYRIRARPSVMRTKLEVAQAVRKGLTPSEVVEKLSLSRATIYRYLKKKDRGP